MIIFILNHYHGFLFLQKKISIKIIHQASEFEFVIISFVQSLIKLHNSMAIHGIYIWLKNTHQLDWSWIRACEHEAAGNLEQAAYEYKLLLKEHFKNLSTINETNGEKISTALVKFLTQKVNKNKRRKYEMFVF